MSIPPRAAGVNPEPAELAQSPLTAETLAEMIEQATVQAAAMLIESQGQGGPVMRTMKKAWTFQRKSQVEKLGKAKAPHWVGYRDLDGVRHAFSCGPGREGKRLADREADRIHAELVTGTFDSNLKKSWAEFRVEFEAKILPIKAHETRRLTIRSLNNFERLVRPGRVSNIKTKTIDDFIAARREERQNFHPPKKGARRRPSAKAYVERELISPRTVNADLRAVKTALRVAVEWGYLKEVPKIRFLTVPEMLVNYVTPDDFDLLYQACDVATHPVVQGVLPADWWRALLTVGYMTGFRIGELLALERVQVDLTAGVAKMWNQKANREDLVPLHPVVVETLKGLRTFDKVFLPWPRHRNLVWKEFNRIQAAAGMPGRYTPHALRRAFGTMNAARIGGPKSLQFLMRHKAGQTTQQFYVNPLEGIEEAVQRLYVPKSLKQTGTEG